MTRWWPASNCLCLCATFNPDFSISLNHVGRPRSTPCTRRLRRGRACQDRKQLLRLLAGRGQALANATISAAPPRPSELVAASRNSARIPHPGPHSAEIVEAITNDLLGDGAAARGAICEVAGRVQVGPGVGEWSPWLTYFFPGPFRCTLQTHRSCNPPRRRSKVQRRVGLVSDPHAAISH